MFQNRNLLSNKSIRAISTSDNSLNPTLSYYDTKIRVKFTGGCLKKNKNFIHSWKSSKHLYCL